jgi:hypothetical protein
LLKNKWQQLIKAGDNNKADKAMLIPQGDYRFLVRLLSKKWNFVDT